MRQTLGIGHPGLRIRGQCWQRVIAAQFQNMIIRDIARKPQKGMLPARPFFGEAYCEAAGCLPQ
jgi:hypothetical protein